VSVRNIYEIEKPSEKLSYMPFENKLHNKFMLWYGCKTTSLAANLREGLRLPSKESADTGLMYGKGIYLTDCFSKAANNAISGQGQGVVFLVEAALGDMHKAFQPEQNRRGALPFFAHSVYGVGHQKPSASGLRDLNSSKPGFSLDH
jgi:hypothetical protein